MKRRAPDGDQIFSSGQIACGQAFLRTGASGAEQSHPLTLGEQVWLVADARIDGRDQLVSELRSAGRRVSGDAPHAELILHAYHAFGDRFLDHLIGDFAFALWDARQGRLTCARDPFGVRPFYYADAGDMLAFASDMAALLRLPRMSRDLDTAAVTDFLLLGVLQDAERTIYADIKCLPPATRMDVTVQGRTQRRFWAPPRHAETRMGRREEYVERFTELFTQAVADRLPGGPVAVQLSGGMDSTSIAAVAADRARPLAHSVTAYHFSCQMAEPDGEETRLAQQVADHLGLPMVRQDLGDYPLFARSNEPALRTDFPLAYPHLATHHDTLDLIAGSGARVLLSGYGGDAAMAGSPSYYPRLLRSGQITKFVREARHYRRFTGSFKGMGLRTVLRSKAPSPAWKPPMPDWLDPGFAASTGSRERWERWWARHEGAVDAQDLLTLPWSQRKFEAFDILKAPVVARYPFYDVRLLQFMLGLPTFMLADKAILREAMRDRLPETVRTRPKTGAPGDPVRTMVTNGKLTARSLYDAAWPAPLAPAKVESAWTSYNSGEGTESTWASWLILQPVAFAKWLAHNSEEL